MIVECGPMGADRKVFEHLAKQLFPGITLDFITLDNKPKLIAECGMVAATLLKQGCDRVIIIWDLFPAWRQNKQTPCRAEDRNLIFESLESARVRSRVSLVCIREELEAWLISDGRAISTVLSTSAHPITIRDERNAESVRNPKKKLKQIFLQNHHRPYNDLVHAEKIVKAIPDFTRLRRCSTFVRFAEMVTGTSFP